MNQTASVPIASRAHTAILAFAFVLIAVAGAYAQQTGRVAQAAPGERQAIALYVSALIVEWASAFYVWKGTRRRGVTLGSLIGGRWRSIREIAADVLVATAVWGLWMTVELLPGANTVTGLLPHTALQYAIWMLLAVSAGFCEEVVFRGYFQRQFHAMTGSAAAAVLLQALVFGVGHFYEGSWAVAKIIMFGVLFGILAWWRKTLRPGILAHAWADVFAVIP